MNQHAGKKESAIAKLERLKEERKKKERDAAIKEIKKRIALRVPQYKYEIPKEVPKVGSKEYHRWMHPWRLVGQTSPGFVGSPVRAIKKMKARKSESDIESDNEEIVEVSSDDSDDDSDDMREKRKLRSRNKRRSQRRAERVAKENEGTFEDFVIPNVVDAQTGKLAELTKSFWSSKEGRINRDTQGILDEQTGRLFFNAKEDYSHYVIDANTTRKAFSRDGNSLKGVKKKGSDVDGRGTYPNHGGHPYGHHSNLSAPKHRETNDLVAKFIKNGPLTPMYHVHWDRGSNSVKVPEGYVNDEDGDADSYVSHNIEGPHSPNTSISATSCASNSRRTSISSVGFDSLESNSQLRHNDRLKIAGEKPCGSSGSRDQGATSYALEDVIKMDIDDKGNKLSAEDSKGIESNPLLSDALNPDNEVAWRSLEDKYYNDICHLAVDYEINKIRTLEMPIEGGPEGMDVRCREYASWKARTLKFIVQAIDDEKEKDEARTALEEDLEINNPEKLLNVVKKHNEERHAHRTYIRNFKYDTEILAVQKLYDMGLVW